MLNHSGPYRKSVFLFQSMYFPVHRWRWSGSSCRVALWLKDMVPVHVLFDQSLKHYEMQCMFWMHTLLNIPWLEPREPVRRYPPGSVDGCCVFLFVQKFGWLAGSPLQAGCFDSPTCWNFLLTGSWRPSSLAGVHLLRLPLQLATWTQDPGSPGDESKPQEEYLSHCHLHSSCASSSWSQPEWTFWGGTMVEETCGRWQTDCGLWALVFPSPALLRLGAWPSRFINQYSPRKREVWDGFTYRDSSELYWFPCLASFSLRISYCICHVTGLNFSPVFSLPL